MNRRNTKLGMVGLVAAGVASCALADDASLNFSPPTNPMPAMVTVQIGGHVIPVMIPPLIPATIKRDLIEAAVRAGGYDTSNNGPGGTILTVRNLPGNLPLTFNPGLTGERADSIRVHRAVRSSIGFLGHFTPMTPQQLPAIFTAGIVTDVGELTAQVSASELNFQTDGPIICQALFQRLAPRAPQYGAQINYAGDRLEVYFDPAYTVTQGGVTFGTTSLSQGATGRVEMPPPLPPRCVADVDDGSGTGVPDGGVTIDDLIYFLSIFESGDPRADVDDGSGTGTADGGVTIDDLLYYLLRFESGC